MGSRKAQYGVRDGFLILREKFLLPNDLTGLDSKTQYDVEICNLFINERFTINDIICMTGDDWATIVQALLRQKVIVDPRQKPRLPEPAKPL
jgi:hypothetical protein